jgi:hypothetical protein
MITGRGGKWITHEKRPKSYGKLLWKRGIKNKLIHICVCTDMHIHRNIHQTLNYT